MLASVFFEALLLGMASGLIASVYMGVLSKEEVLNFWWQWGNRFEGRWFFAPIWGCEKCFAGQFAMWGYLMTRKIDVTTSFLPVPGLQIQIEGYNLLAHIFSISAAIFFSLIFSKIINLTTHE